MFEFEIQKSGTSEERLICFLSDSTDQAFRQALKDILEPHGYFCNSDEHHVFMRNVNGEYKLRQLTISSDSWFVWGECDTWGKNIALNQELISWLEQKLLDSGLFKLRQKPNNARHNAAFGRCDAHQVRARALIVMQKK